MPLPPVSLSAGRKHREDRNREYIRIDIVPIIHSSNNRDDINIFLNCSDYYDRFRQMQLLISFLLLTQVKILFTS